MKALHKRITTLALTTMLALIVIPRVQAMENPAIALGAVGIAASYGLVLYAIVKAYCPPRAKQNLGPKQEKLKQKQEINIRTAQINPAYSRTAI